MENREAIRRARSAITPSKQRAALTALSPRLGAAMTRTPAGKADRGTLERTWLKAEKDLRVEKLPAVVVVRGRWPTTNAGTAKGKGNPAGNRLAVGVEAAARAAGCSSKTWIRRGRERTPAAEDRLPAAVIGIG
jgi:hypothetical protein